MAAYEIEADKIGAYAKTLTAETVDTVTVKSPSAYIELITDGSAAIYFTIDGTAPTVGGANCYVLPAVPSVREIRVRASELTDASGNLAVKLISAGTPEYHVSKAREP
jgi:hypothetical protein